MSLFDEIFSLLKNNSDFNPELLSFLPRSYKRIGHIALINLDERLNPYGSLIGESMLKVLSSNIKTIAQFTRSISGIERRPSIEYLAGNPSMETVHLEHKTKFFLDPTLQMFSAGNHYERKRIINFVSSLSRKNTVILDMFSCVGNLSLPVANQNQNCRVIALEINPEAVDYLKKSIKLNKIPENRFKIILGDNRVVSPENIADLVILGYFGIDAIQLEKAVFALNIKNDVCWLMIHDIGNSSAESSVINSFKRIIKSNKDWKLKSIKKHIVKSIGPRLEHWVFDCTLQRKYEAKDL